MEMGSVWGGKQTEEERQSKRGGDAGREREKVSERGREKREREENTKRKTSAHTEKK